MAVRKTFVTLSAITLLSLGIGSTFAQTNERKPNHLLGVQSPYLQQHVYNPVDWYPWGKEAFETSS